MSYRHALSVFKRRYPHITDTFTVSSTTCIYQKRVHSLNFCTFYFLGYKGNNLSL